MKKFLIFSLLAGVLLASSVVSTARAYSLDEFLADPVNKEAFDSFPPDVQEKMRLNDTKLKASEQKAIAAMPAGTVQCFDHYTYGSVEMFLEPTTLTPVSGSVLQFTGNIKNENPYPIVNGTVFVKIFHQKQTNAQNSVDNGYPLVDQFIALENVTIPANGEREAAFDWNIPENTEGGKYYAALYFSTHDRYNLAGIMFMDDVTGNQVDFEIVNPGKVAPAVSFDRNGTTIDGFAYNFSKPPRLFSKTEPVEVKVKINNPRSESVNLPVTWKLAPWGDLQTSRTIDSKQEMVTLKAKETKTLSYTVQPHNNTVSYVTVELTDQGTKSIQNIRFARDGVAETRLEFPTILNYPLEAGRETGVFVCAHSTNMPSVSGNEITLTVTDSSGSTVFTHTYTGTIPVDMTGILGAFTPERNLTNFSVTATLVRDGKTIESVTQAYRCKDFDPEHCSAEAGAVTSTSGESLTVRVFLCSLFILLGMIGLILIALKLQIKKQVTPMLLALMFAGVTLLSGATSAEAKSATVPFTFSNDVYAGSYPSCDSGSYLQGDGSALYSLVVTDLGTGSVIPEGSSIAVGTLVRFALQYDNDYNTKTVNWTTIRAGCFGSPTGAWTPGAVRSVLTPLSINPPTIAVSTNSAFTCSSQTDCTVTGTGPASVTANFSATFGKYYRDYDSMTCGRDGDASCGIDSTEELAFPLSAQPISLMFTAFQPNQKPSAPTIVGPATCFVGDTVTFTFTSTDPDNDQVRYGIDWDGNSSVDTWSPGSGYVNSGTSGSGTFTCGVVGGHTFQAAAQDIKGTNSSWTPKTITVNPVPPPATPTGLSATTDATCGSGKVNLSWNSVAGAIQYGVLRNGSVSVYSGPLTSTVDTGLTNGTTYNYVVAAMNAAGVWSSNSASVPGTAPAACAGAATISITPPTNVTVGGTGTLSWTTTGATSIDINSCTGPGAAAWNQININGPANIPTGSKSVTATAAMVGDTTCNAVQAFGPGGPSTPRSFTWRVSAVAVPSGTLSAPSCTIPAGSSSCVSSVSWSTSGGVTSPSVYQNGTSFSTAPSSLGTNRTINYGANTFELKDGGTVLATQIATASCPPTAPWNSTICAGAAAVAPTLNFSGSPLSITSGNSSTLTWTVTGVADGCWASGPAGWSGWKSTTGSSEVVSPTVTTTYTLQCWNAGVTNGPKDVTITVSGVPPPSSPCPPYSGSGCSIPPTAAGGTSAGTCDVAGGYSGTCSGTCSSSGSGNWNLPITNNCIFTPPPPPSGPPTLTTTGKVVKRGTVVPIQWDTNNGDEGLCTLSGGTLSGNITRNASDGVETGSVNQTINGRTTYTLTCPSGSAVLTIDIIPEDGET